MSSDEIEFDLLNDYDLSPRQHYQEVYNDIARADWTEDSEPLEPMGLFYFQCRNPSLSGLQKFCYKFIIEWT